MPRLTKRALRMLQAPLHVAQARRELHAFHAHPRALEESVDWALARRTKGHAKIRTVQIRSEILELARRVAALRPRNVLEIGTDQGGTLFLWSQIASRLVVGCDLREPGVRRLLYRRFPPPRSGCRVRFLRGDSHAPDFRTHVEEAFGGEPVDFLFIDGDHRAAGVEADWESYRSLVRPGGLVAFHDVAERQPIPENEVFRFWSRLRKRENTAEIVADPEQCGFGIGVVHV